MVIVVITVVVMEVLQRSGTTQTEMERQKWKRMGKRIIGASGFIHAEHHVSLCATNMIVAKRKINFLTSHMNAST